MQTALRRTLIRSAVDQVVFWMKSLGLTVSIDELGNVVGVRRGSESGPPVMVGSHIDTVRTGGRWRRWV